MDTSVRRARTPKGYVPRNLSQAERRPTERYPWSPIPCPQRVPSPQSPVPQPHTALMSLVGDLLQRTTPLHACQLKEAACPPGQVINPGSLQARQTPGTCPVCWCSARPFVHLLGQPHAPQLCPRQPDSEREDLSPCGSQDGVLQPGSQLREPVTQEGGHGHGLGP